jgi:hypothetical protein
MWLALSIAAALVILLGTNWATVRANLSAAWQGVTGAASGAGSLIRSQWTGLVIALALGVLLGVAGKGLGGFDWREWVKIPDVVAPVEPAPVVPTKITYVYEKDQGEVPSVVRVALDKLNRKGISATAFEDDTTDGSGAVPEQYAIALAEATKVGVPALVSQAGSVVLKVVKAPTTEQQVLEVAP